MPMKLCEFIKLYNLEDFLLDSCKLVNDPVKSNYTLDQFNEFDGSCCEQHQNVYDKMYSILLKLLSHEDTLIKRGAISIISHISFNCTSIFDIHELLTNFIRLMLQDPIIDLEITKQVLNYTLHSNDASIIEHSSQIILIFEKSLKYKSAHLLPWGSTDIPTSSVNIPANICANSSHLLSILSTIPSNPQFHNLLISLKSNLSPSLQIKYLISASSLQLDDFSFTSQSAYFYYNSYFLHFSFPTAFPIILSICDANLPYSNTLLHLFQPKLTNINNFNDLLSLSSNCDAPLLFSILLDISEYYYQTTLNDNKYELFNKCLTSLTPTNPNSHYFFDLLKFKFEGDLVFVGAICLDSTFFTTSMLNALTNLLSCTHFNNIFSCFSLFTAILSTYHYFLDSHYPSIVKSLAGVIVQSQFDSIPKSTSLYQKALFTLDHFIAISPLIRSDNQFNITTLITTYTMALNKWPSIAKSILHSIHVLIHAYPLQMCKYLPIILTTSSQIIGHLNISIYILEMLSSLSNCPKVYHNLSDDDFKMIFGIALQFIETTNTQNTVQSSYHLYLAFSVINTWLLHVRNHQFQFLLHRMTLAMKKNPLVRDRILICVDFMSRMLLNGTDSSDRNADLNEPTASKILQYYLHGHCLVSVHSNSHPKIIIRRPSGTTVHTPTDAIIGEPLPIVTPTFNKTTGSFFGRKSSISIRRKPSNPTTLTEILGQFPETYFMNKEKTINNFIFVQSASHLLVDADTLSSVPLPINDKLTRAVNVFDFTPTVDFHKFGICYLRNGQNEVEMLSNTQMGNEFESIYKQFGKVVEIGNEKYKYYGGLNKETDGTHTLIWHDEITYMVFINSTMMPNHENDPTRMMKKRFIGNCWVNIIFKEQEATYTPMKSDSIFVNIIIEPWEYPNLYKIWIEPVLGDIGGFGPLEVPRILEKEAVAVFVRQIAFHLNIYAQIQVQSEQGEYISEWRQRLQIIEKLGI